MGTSVPMELGVRQPPDMWICSPTWKLPKPLSGIFMEVSSRRHNQLLTSFPAHLPSLERGVGGGQRGAENSKVPH